jgi:ketosteroid isomerase-like protein
MADLVSKIKDIYSAFGRGDVATILGSMTDDCSWEFEAPAELSWGGNRRGPKEAAGFFTGIAAEHADPVLKMTEFFESADTVAAFGRYEVTIRATGVRIDVPVAHYFKFRGGKISRYINFTNTAAFVEAAKRA